MAVKTLSLLLTFVSFVFALPTVTVEAGVLVGTTTSLAGASITVNKYLGIPFAASPTRFSPPASATAFSGTFNATQYGYACPQQFNYPEAQRAIEIAIYDTPPPPAGENEDCLNLNVYTPGTNTTGNTVMVWFYGGDLQYGSNSQQTYDGSSFATYQQVVLVTVNYRTNVFGFPGPVPQLLPNNTNLGFQDQKFALQWIQRNIAAFGGDPAKVTIFGESAGAASVDNLITTNPVNPPFRAAIMESGQNAIYVNTSYTVPTSWNSLVAALNCSNTTDQLSCVRAAPQLTITSIIEHAALPFVPYNDNVTSLANPNAARLAGNIAKVPILTGTNANEGRSFLVGQDNTTAYLTNLLGNQPFYISVLEAAFPIGSPGITNDYDQLSQIFTEVVFQCPCATVANNTLAIGVPAWRYLYNASFPNLQPFLSEGIDLKGIISSLVSGSMLIPAAFHSSEVPLVFNTYTNPPALPGLATQFEGRLSEFMQASWATFARNPYGGPGWAENPQLAVLGTGATSYTTGAGVLRSVVPAGSLDARCGLFAPIYAATGMA